MVCSRCEDLPQRQLGAKILSPDPLPIFNARPEPFTTTGFGHEQSNIMTQPDPTTFGTAVDGAQMAMPDGRAMLMPGNPSGELPLLLTTGAPVLLNSGGEIFLNSGGNL